MSIFGIIMLALLVGIVIGATVFLCVCMPFCYYEVSRWMILLCVCTVLAACIAGTFIGIGINTECEREYVARYKIQKETIEMSLDCEDLSGMERVQLVNKAVEINGEMAERKARYERWHHVTYDDTLYDNIDFIRFK